MSVLKLNNLQIGQSATATNNFTWYQPTSPDGTLRLGLGNGQATSQDLITVNSAGNLGLGVTPSAWWSGARVNQIGQGGVIEGRTGSTVFSLGSNYFINSSIAYTYIGTGNASRYDQLVGEHRWWTAPSGTAGNPITFTQAMTLNASGGLQTLNTIGVGNATPSTSGAGITFPATQSASSDANTLDDYEEGTYTPTLTFSTSGSITYFTQTGSYTKIGNTVRVDLYVQVNGVSSPTGQFRFSLPFTPSGTHISSPVSYAFVNNLTGFLFVVTSSTYAYGVMNTGGTNADWPSNCLQYGSEIRISLVYKV